MFKLLILNHRIIGHPYIPICKFQLMVGGQCVQQSEFVNPPLGVCKMGSSSNKGENIRQSMISEYKDQSYMRQFPITFTRTYLKEGQSLQLKLVQLMKNGRQKQVGYSKLIINHEVIGRTTKHKIVKIGLDEKTGEILSIIEIGVEIHQQLSKSVKTNPSRNTNHNNSNTNQQLPKQSIEQSSLPLQTHNFTNNNNLHDSQQSRSQISSSIDQNAKFSFHDDSYYSQDNRNNNQSSMANYKGNNDYLLTAKDLRNNTGTGNNVQYYQTKSKHNDNITKDSRKQLSVQIATLSPGKIYRQQLTQENGLNNNSNSYQSKSMMDKKEHHLRVNGISHNKIPSYERREKIESQQMDIIRDNPHEQNHFNIHSRRYLRLDQSKLQSNPNNHTQHYENSNLKTIDTSSQQQLYLQQKYNKTKRRLKYILNTNEPQNNYTNKPHNVNRLQTEQIQSYNTANSSDRKTFMRNPVIKIEDYQYQYKDGLKGNGVRINMGEGSGGVEFNNTRLRFYTKGQKDKSISSHMIPTRQSPIANFRTSTTPINSQSHSLLALQQRPAVEYFHNYHQTNPQDCYILSNLYIIYENSLVNKQTSFKVKYITFLTYNLYERILRINCLSGEISVDVGKMKYLDADKVSHFILKSQNGQIKQSSVCDRYSNLQLYLPKHSLIFRLQVIMQDESIFIGTLANQIGMNIKSTLHLKRSLHQSINTNVQQNVLLESMNFIVDVGDRNSQQIVINKQIVQSKQGQSSIYNQPSRKPYKASTIESLPRVNNPNTITNSNSTSIKTQNQFNQFDSTLKRGGNRSPSLSTTTVEKTLHAITAYKVSLSPNTGPLHQMSNSDSSRVSLKYKSGLNYHVNFDLFNQQHMKKRTPIRLHQNHLTTNYIDQGGKSHAMEQQKGFSAVRLKQNEYDKDLPKIVVNRLDKKQKDSYKKVKGDVTMNTRKNKSISTENFSSKNQIRLQFLKKVLGHKVASDEHKNSSIQSIKQKKSPRKSKQHIIDNESKRFKKLKTQPNEKLDQTKVFNYDPKSRYQYHNKLSMSPNKLSHQQHSYAKELKCMKNHMPIISSLSKNSEDGSNKLLLTYSVSIRKIEFLRLMDRSNDHIKRKQRYDESDDENGEIQTNGGNQFFTDNDGSFEVFLKLFNEAKRKKELITPSKGMKQTFSKSPLYNDGTYTEIKSQQSLDYLSCSWYFEEGQFLFNKLTIDDFITIQAYGDLASIDNHQFLGNCVLSVQEIFYMRNQRRITGYLVKQKKTESHLTVYFEIQQNKQLRN